MPANARDTGDMGLIPGSGRSLGEGNGNPLQYSCWENPMDRGAGRLQSVRTERVRHTERVHTHRHTMCHTQVLDSYPF